MLLRWLAMCLLSIVALGPAQAAGLNLRWDKCFGDGGVLYRDFACDTNIGSERLVGSFELDADQSNVVGLECYVNIGSYAPTLPAWWELRGTGCRVIGTTQALTITAALPEGSSACQDWGSGVVSANIANYALEGGSSNRTRLTMVNAVPSTMLQTLVADQEYHAFSLMLRHQKSVGSPACGGCLEPVVVYFSAMFVQQSNPTNTTRYWDGANGDVSQWVSWQQGFPIVQGRGCATTCGGICCVNPTVFFSVIPNASSPTRPSTWSMVKSLYR